MSTKSKTAKAPVSTKRPATTGKATRTAPTAKQAAHGAAATAPQPKVEAPATAAIKASNAPKAKQPQPAAAQTITVAKTDKKFDGARASWYAALLAHDGRTTDEFVAACTAKPPSMPKSGKAEDPRGWLRWFVRERIAQVA